MDTYRRILVPVDGSATSNKALVAALQIAREGGGRVRLVHVVDELSYVTGFEAGAIVLDEIRKAAQRVLDSALAMAGSAGVQADVKLLDQPGLRLGEVVAEAARNWEADLVVVGTHGRHGFSRFVLGSGAEQIIRMSPVPVLVIHGGDEKGPT
jgi:nucleotide-binding universal stress UspA family protein